MLCASSTIICNDEFKESPLDAFFSEYSFLQIINGIIFLISTLTSTNEITLTLTLLVLSSSTSLISNSFDKLSILLFDLAIKGPICSFVINDLPISSQ